MAMAHADSIGGQEAAPGVDALLPPHMRVRRKIVYFTVGQRKEVAVFEHETPADDVQSKRRSFVFVSHFHFAQIVSCYRVIARCVTQPPG